MFIFVRVKCEPLALGDEKARLQRGLRSDSQGLRTFCNEGFVQCIKFKPGKGFQWVWKRCVQSLKFLSWANHVLSEDSVMRQTSALFVAQRAPFKVCTFAISLNFGTRIYNSEAVCWVSWERVCSIIQETDFSSWHAYGTWRCCRA